MALAGFTLADLTHVLGLDHATIVRAVRRGQTLKDLAAEAGRSLDETIAALVAYRRQQMEQRLDKLSKDLQGSAEQPVASPQSRWVRPQRPIGRSFRGSGAGSRLEVPPVLPPGRFAPGPFGPAPYGPPSGLPPEPPAAPPPGTPSDPANDR